MVYEVFAVPLGAGRHGASAHDYELRVGVRLGALPSAGEVLCLLRKGLRAVEPAAERLEADLHLNTKRRTRLTALKSPWLSIGHHRESVFLYSQHCAMPKKKSAMNALFGQGIWM